MSYRVFASTFTYPYTKLYGQAWVKEALRSDPDDPNTPAMWKAFCPARMAKDIAFEFGAVPLLDIGNTYISQGRSMAAGAFLRSDADVWITFDDDVTSDR